MTGINNLVSWQSQLEHHAYVYDFMRKREYFFFVLLFILLLAQRNQNNKKIYNFFLIFYIIYDISIFQSFKLSSVLINIAKRWIRAQRKKANFFFLINIIFPLIHHLLLRFCLCVFLSFVSGKCGTKTKVVNLASIKWNAWKTFIFFILTFFGFIKMPHYIIMCHRMNYFFKEKL